VNPANYTVTAGSTVITLHEAYIRTFNPGTYIFRAEWTNGHAYLTLIVSDAFGHVPQTGVADITGTVVAMWLSILLTASLSVCLYLHLRTKRKRTGFGSYNGKYK